MNSLSVRYYGHVFDASGYGHAARAYIHALHNAGVDLSVVDLGNGAPQVDDGFIQSLLNTSTEADFHIFHGIPPEWARLAFPLRNAIGLTVWETDVMPTQWRNVLNHAIDVWLPCEFNVGAFRRDLQSAVFKLPHPIFPPSSNGRTVDPNGLLGTSERDWVVYSIFEWQDRKCPELLLEAYLHAFPNAEDTVLVLKTNRGAARTAGETLDAIRSRARSSGRVVLRAESWGDAEIAALHARGDCYISLHRGEGWSYPLFEAASRGTPVIATGYSGPLDYLDPDAHHLVRYRLAPVRQPYRYYNPAMRWADPEVGHAIELLRWVRDHRAVAREKSGKAASRIRQAYALEVVGAAARSRLMQLLKRSHPERWRRLDQVDRRQRLAPPVPVPADWYDEAYFEHGLKSNWSDGYTWSLFSGLFHETAVFLTQLFPEAASVLDVGCGKGFLVRALRELGTECWGFDFSPWAVEHAEPDAKPFVARAGVDDFVFDRPYDLLVVFEVFEHLTDEQIMGFLSRARACTRLGLLATIPSFDAEADRAQHADHDEDLSHITLQSRAWWHERFLKAGWRQDGLHRVVQRICQQHALPLKMGWKLYVYAP